MKQRITVTVDSDSYQLLKAYDVNISGLVSTTMQNEDKIPTANVPVIQSTGT